MPDHLHMILQEIARGAARRALGRLLGAFARELGGGPQWQPVPAAQPVLGDDKLERLLRYVHLNPDRAGLVSDPMSWAWSTHRDVIGARVDPWVRAADVADALGRPEAGFAAWFHAYVSSDPSVAVGGTPMPCAAAAASLDEIAHAARCALPLPQHANRRRHLFVLVAAQLGHPTRAIAAHAGIHRDSVARWERREDPELLHTGLLYAGDPRLREPARFRRPRAA